jgi:hypothetical protein
MDLYNGKEKHANVFSLTGVDVGNNAGVHTTSKKGMRKGSSSIMNLLSPDKVKHLA